MTMKSAVSIILSITATSFLGGCGANPEGAEGTSQIEAALGEGSPFEVKSASFESKSDLPDQYSCEAKPFGSSISPELTWSNAPEGTLSYAILFRDDSIVQNAKRSQDYNFQNFGYHWLMWNIPADITSMPEGLEAAEFPEGMGGAQQWGWNANPYQFFGPCPSWQTHCFGAPRTTDEYSFKVFALPVDHVDLVFDPDDPRNRVRQFAEYLDEIAIESARIQATSDASPSSFDRVCP